jgi:hypothetical protein
MGPKSSVRTGAKSSVRAHQYNDPEIAEYFIGHGVEYRLLGDHLFSIHSGEGELPGLRASGWLPRRMARLRWSWATTLAVRTR